NVLMSAVRWLHPTASDLTGDRKGGAALAVSPLSVLCPQGFKQAIDATVLDRRGKPRALCYVHADAFDDDVDDSELAVGPAQSPIEADVLGGGHVDLAAHKDGAVILRVRARDLHPLPHI